MATLGVIAAAVLFIVLESDDPIFRVSMATAYVALALLALTLAFGPVARLAGRRYPLSTDIRRDVGIWSGVFALAHIGIGLQVHMRGKMWEYFVHTSRGSTLPRFDPFGLANYAGLAATVILTILLVTSNDVSMRRLGPGNWQRIHRVANWALALTLLHGAAYQWIEKRPWPFVLLFVALTLLSVAPRLAEMRRDSAERED